MYAMRLHVLLLKQRSWQDDAGKSSFSEGKRRDSSAWLWPCAVPRRKHVGRQASSQLTVGTHKGSGVQAVYARSAVWVGKDNVHWSGDGSNAHKPTLAGRGQCGKPEKEQQFCKGSQ